MTILDCKIVNLGLSLNMFWTARSIVLDIKTLVFASFSCLWSKARSTLLRLSNKKPKKTRCFFEVRKVLSNVKKSISLTFGSAKPLILTSQHGF